MNKTAQDALRGAALAASEPTESPREQSDRQPYSIENLIEDIEERMLHVEQAMLTNRIDGNKLAEERNKGKHSAYQASLYMVKRLLSAPGPSDLSGFGRLEEKTKEEQRG